MKTKTLSAVFTFAALTAVAGSAVAADAHDAYYQAFYGSKSSTTGDMVGKAPQGKSSDNLWSGHEAYLHAFASGDANPATPREIMGKAAYGTSSGPDPHAIYRRSFGGD